MIDRQVCGIRLIAVQPLHLANLVLGSTEISRQLGFLRFSTIDASRAFIEKNHPFIYLYGPSAGTHDRSTKVRIAYSREREDRARAKGAGDWTCRKVSDIDRA